MTTVCVCVPEKDEMVSIFPSCTMILDKSLAAKGRKVTRTSLRRKAKKIRKSFYFFTGEAKKRNGFFVPAQKEEKELVD